MDVVIIWLAQIALTPHVFSSIIKIALTDAGGMAEAREKCYTVGLNEVN